jgi:hypothetical protein
MKPEIAEFTDRLSARISTIKPTPKLTETEKGVLFGARAVVADYLIDLFDDDGIHIYDRTVHDCVQLIKHTQNHQTIRGYFQGE